MLPWSTDIYWVEIESSATYTVTTTRISFTINISCDNQQSDITSVVQMTDKY